MKSKIIVLVLSLSAIFCGYTQTNSENLFYMVDTPESFASFKNNANQISIVCPQTFWVSEEGVITGSMDKRVIDISKANQIKVMPLIMNKGFNQELLHQIVSKPASRKRSIAMMLELANRYELDGWQFDLEGLHISDKDDFTQYFKETAEAFHKEGLQLSAALVHRYENVGGPSAYHLFLYENWRAGYAIKKLSEIGDFISIMTYDQHTRRTPPGPVAGKEWIEKIVKYTLDEGVDPNKLSLGVPNYSVHWFADYSEERGGYTNGRQIKYNRVQHLLEKFDATTLWDEKAGCNYAIWDNGGVNEYIYIENGKSLKTKLDILTKYKLRGISVWVLGSEAPDFWSILQQNVTKK